MTHDPGGKIRLKMLPGIAGGATISEDETRRTLLWRRWSDDESMALWIGMNPSTADPNFDDPTVRREFLRTRAGLEIPGSKLELGMYMKVNVMDYRATDPKMLRHVDYPSSPLNETAIAMMAEKAKIIIAAWGAVHPSLMPHVHHAMSVLRKIGAPVYCLGLTKEGHPRHPLYIALDTPLQRFNIGDF